MIKILFVSHNFHFIDDLINFLKKDKNYLIHRYKVNNFIIDKQKKYLIKNINNYNIIFCEWFVSYALYLSKIVNPNKQKLFIRLHRFEITKPFFTLANWNNIKKVIFVNKSIENLVNSKIPKSRNKTLTIYNYIKFPINRTITNNIQDKFNICMIGYVPKLKRPDIAINIFRKLKKIDNRFHLFFIGKNIQFIKNNKNELAFYKKHFINFKDIHVFPFMNDLTNFYNRMGHILICSDIESFHVSSHEALNFGIYPYYTGGCINYLKNIIPNELLFDNIDKIVNSILKNNNNYSKQQNIIKYQKYLDQFKLLEINNKILKTINE